MAYGFRTPLPDETRLHSGSFVLETCLGMGGFGITYRSLDTGLTRQVAVKEFFPSTCIRNGQNLAPGGEWSASNLEGHKLKFMEEGRVLARLHHPGIVQVYSVFEENDTVYLVMEFVNGQTIEDYRVARGGQLSVDEALRVIRQAGEALQVVHCTTPPLIHRDIKPANLMMKPDGQVVLIDFGAAREFRFDTDDEHTVILSRGFAPVEQHTRHGMRGPFTDVYGLAATFYSLITGEIPMDARLREIGEPMPTPRELRDDIPEALSNAILKGMSLLGKDRPQTVKQFLALFDASVTARPQGVRRRSMFLRGDLSQPGAPMVLPQPSARVISVSQPPPANVAGQSPASQINPIDGAEMIWIPPGEFLMGDDDISDNPRRTVTLSGYWIYKNLVTVGQYRKYCEATGTKMPRKPTGFSDRYLKEWRLPDHPVVNVNWHDTTAYCKWAGVVLPTEAQWEKAARGTDGRKYPWGETWEASKVWSSVKQVEGGTTAVGRYSISPYGCSDMSGNARQWCANWYDEGYGQHAPDVDPMGPETGNRRGLRGGGWNSYLPSQCRCAHRDFDGPRNRNSVYGFRCARTL